MSYTASSESVVVNGFQSTEISQVLRYLQFNDVNLHINAKAFTANSWLPWRGELPHFERRLNAAILTKSSNLIVGDQCLILLSPRQSTEESPWVCSLFEFNCSDEAFEKREAAFDSGDMGMLQKEDDIFLGASYNQMLVITNNDVAGEGLHEKSATCDVRQSRRRWQIELSFTLPLISQLSVGHDHAVALTSTTGSACARTGWGQVLSWGCNTRGELGLGLMSKCVRSETFLPVELLHGVDVVKVTAGGWHSCALTVEGDVYFWGWNESGQLGLDPLEVGSVITEPTLFNLSQNGQTRATDDVSSPFVYFMQVELGSRHSVLLDTENNVWTFGWNEYGQCSADGTPTKEWKKPAKVVMTGNRKPSSIGAAPWASIYIFERKK